MVCSYKEVADSITNIFSSDMPSGFEEVAFTTISNKNFRVCLDLEKLEGKKKI